MTTKRFSKKKQQKCKSGFLDNVSSLVYVIPTIRKAQKVHKNRQVAKATYKRSKYCARESTKNGLKRHAGRFYYHNTTKSIPTEQRNDWKLGLPWSALDNNVRKMARKPGRNSLRYFHTCSAKWGAIIATRNVTRNLCVIDARMYCASNPGVVYSI